VIEPLKAAERKNEETRKKVVERSIDVPLLINTAINPGAPILPKAPLR
jgi:hypothetical protein